MNIKKDISAWDGKSADDIEAILDRHQGDPDFVDEMLALVREVDCQKGATWLLKKCLESGNALNKQQITEVYGALPALADWESKLHVLQCIPYMPIDKRQRKNVEAFLRTTLTDTNKFVRAWSYNGFYELARQYPEYTDEVKQFFAMAMRDEAASVKARIRNIMKKGF